MANSQTHSPIIIIHKLKLVGVRKNYTIPFNAGLNIIHGDSDTGKSSILNLIDYCLGASEVDLYTEIENSGRFCLLEVELNGKVYTIKRNIFEPNALIEVFNSVIDEMDNVFALEYGPNYNKSGDAGFISDFFLDALSIPKIETKQSPSKADSKMNRLSFRDIMKYNYLTQDDVGSKDLLDRKNFTIAVKNQETFKFLHNLLDTNITELQALIAEKTRVKSELDHKYNTISSFFRETQLKTADLLISEKNDIAEKLKSINAELDNLNREMISNTETDSDLRVVIRDFEIEIREKDRVLDSNRVQLRQNVLLKNDYQLDIQKLKSSVKLFEKLPLQEKMIDCPVCSNSLKLESLKENVIDSDPDLLEQEVRSLNRRTKDITNMIAENRNQIFLLEGQIAALYEKVNQAKSLLDNQTKEMISPFLAQRDGLLTSRAKFLENLSNIEYTLKLRNQLSEIVKSSAKITLELEKLYLSMQELQSNTPTVEFVTNNIADYLKEFLSEVRMNNVFGVNIDARTFLPKVRDREYFQLTSGGVRTLVSVGYYISILQNGLAQNSNHPNFLMIDTIAKYLGKTKSKYMAETDKKEDVKEGIRADDPTKYINMYKYLINVCHGRTDLQVIIVDNDIPQEIEPLLTESIVKEFNVDGFNGLPRGFIDDIYDLNNEQPAID
jgi:hypothetical protein